MRSEGNLIHKSVVFHKVVERRLDSVGGGALAALIETFLKEDGYYCAPFFDENLHLRYELSNNSERIGDIVDYNMTECELNNMFTEIKDLLENNNRVLFAGQPCHCKALQEFVNKDITGLIVVELICKGASSNELIDKYRQEVGEFYGDSVIGVHFHDKEFSYCNSKRLRLKSGKTVFLYEKEPFDVLVNQHVFLKEKCCNCCLHSSPGHYSDLSIDVYDLSYKIGDHLGYSLLSTYTEKGDNLYEKALRRLEIFLENDNIKGDLSGKVSTQSKKLSVDILKDHSLRDCEKLITGSQKRIVLYVKQLLRILLTLKTTSRLHIGPLFKFFKYNFFRKNTKTNFWGNGYMYIAPYSEFNLATDAVIELHGPLYVGSAKRVASSHLETRLWMCRKSQLIIRKQCVFAFGCDIEIFKDAVIDIGELVTANPITIICGERITMGTPVNIAKGTEVRDTNSHLLSTQGFKMNRPITIGNHVWIASHCSIMPGSKIGDGCIVAGVSYLNKKIPSFTIAEGHPADVKSEIKYFRM